MAARRWCPLSGDRHRVRFATVDDARTVAGLARAMDLEFGAADRPGFVADHAAAWQGDHANRPTWLAEREGAGSDAVGIVQATVVQKMPSLRRPTTSWLHIALVYVDPGHRGRGVAESMLRAMLAWGVGHGVERYQLNAESRARSLYERVGFTQPVDRLMELRLVDRQAGPSAGFSQSDR